MSYKKKTLKNGLRVIAVPMPESLTTTVLVLSETGSTYESKRLNGVSHFLEHLCFKGTKKRPDPTAISTELDGCGAESNAFTGHEYTGYYARAEKKHFKKIFDVIADVYKNPVLPKQEIEKEKGVIIGEIDMYEDHPMDLIGDVLTDALYGDQPAGWRILGTRENIRAMTRADIAGYRRKHYVPGATVVVVAGNVSPASVFNTAEEYFSDMPAGRKAGKPPHLPFRRPEDVRQAQRNGMRGGKPAVKESQSAPAFKAVARKTNQTHLALGFRGWSIHDDRVPALAVLAGVLGKGMSSRLFKKLRDEMGVGYYVYAANDFSTDHGYFSVFAGVENARLEESLDAVITELRRMKDELTPSRELEKAKNLIIGGLFRTLEASDDMAEYYGKAEVRRIPLKTPEELSEEIRAVSAEDIQRVARELFVAEKENCALIGPKQSEKRLKEVLAEI